MKILIAFSFSMFSIPLLAANGGLSISQVEAMKSYCSQNIQSFCPKAHRIDCNISAFTCLKENSENLENKCQKVMEVMTIGAQFSVPSFSPKAKVEATEVTREVSSTSFFQQNAERLKAKKNKNRAAEEAAYQKEKEAFLEKFKSKDK